jgi:hypothetical protein
MWRQQSLPHIHLLSTWREDRCREKSLRNRGNVSAKLYWLIVSTTRKRSRVSERLRCSSCAKTCAAFEEVTSVSLHFLVNPLPQGAVHSCLNLLSYTARKVASFLSNSSKTHLSKTPGKARTDRECGNHTKGVPDGLNHTGATSRNL